MILIILSTACWPWRFLPPFRCQQSVAVDCNDDSAESGAGNVRKVSSSSLFELLDLLLRVIDVRDFRLCGTHLSITDTWFACRTSVTIGVSNLVVYFRAFLLVSVTGLISCVRRCHFALERTADDFLQDSTGH